jgi:C4-dicarboxylate-specific signal transduction histidine kinase
VTLAGGERRWIYSRGRLERDAAGRIVRVLGVSLDVTRSHTAELEVEKQRNELTHLSRVSVLGELSGSLAHELNQPLTAILFNSQAALRILERDTPDLVEVREILTDISEQDRAAGEVIRRLRLLLTKGEVHPQPLDVEEVIQEALKMARGELVHLGVLMAMDVRHGLPAVQADRIQLQQVLLNLVTNACDAMGSVDRTRRVLTVRARLDPDGFVRVSATDGGPGIPAEILPRVFQPFFTTKATGMGLGLAVCRSIIQAHGGQLWAENAANGGATFSFTLPAAAASAPAATA